MGNLVDNKFTWVIPNFNPLRISKILSNEFVIGGCKWKLYVHPRSYPVGHMALYLRVAEDDSLPCGWRRHAKISLTFVNQFSESLPVKREIQHWFDEKQPSYFCYKFFHRTKLQEIDSGFLVNGELKIIADIDVLEVIGKIDETEESVRTSQSPKKRKRDNDVPNKTQQLKEVNGFLVLPSQAEAVKRIFEKHPNMTLNFRAKDQDLRTLCMNALLNLINTLCRSLQDLCIDDLGTTKNALIFLKKSGFNVDWLERKLEEVKEKKTEEEIGESRIQELEEELKDIDPLIEKKNEELNGLKQKRSVTEALLKKEKAKVLAARTPQLTLDDVV